MAFSLAAIDDDEEILYTLEAMASSQGWVMRTTTDPCCALEWVKEGLVDMLLVDYHMPAMSGLEVIRTARQISSEVILLVLTVEQGNDVARDMMLAGADDFVSKPVRLADFSARIRLHSELLGYRKAGRWDKKGKGVSEDTSRKVYEMLLSRNILMTASQVAEVVGISYPTAHRYLEHLTKNGQIIKVSRHEDGKSGRPKSYYGIKSARL